MAGTRIVRLSGPEVRGNPAIPAALGDLAASARREGHAHVDRLIVEYETGANRFDGPGEALFAAFVGDRTVGVGGLNADSCSPDGAGRVRRLFVLPIARRRGVGNAIMDRIEALARGHFTHLQLFTTSAAAGRFYLHRGYRPVDDRPRVSHEKTLARTP